jgi:LPS-assembly protein
MNLEIIPVLQNKRIKKFVFLILLGGILSSFAFTTTAKSSTPVNQLSADDIAKQLGWIEDDDSPTVCPGYYQEKAISLPPGASTKTTAWKADRVLLQENRATHLKGNVVITQPNMQLSGDRAISYPSPKTNKPNIVDIFGHVRLQQQGMLASGTYAHINLGQKSAVIDNAIYRYQITPSERQYVYNSQHQLQQVQIKGVNYHGQALRIEHPRPKYTVLKDARLTSCNPLSSAWYFSSSTVELDQKQGQGTSYNTIMWFYHIPVLYTPIFKFPIDNRRKSGLLYPTIGQSTDSGYELGIPYYWNMAPNYDMTITPNIITKRGLKTDTLFRYLNTMGSGQIYYSFIPKDAVFEKLKSEVANGSAYPNTDPAQKDALINSPSNRSQLSWDDTTRYDPYWQSIINLEYVSDDYFISDFGRSPLTEADYLSTILPTTQLIQSVGVQYAQKHWSVNTELENYQTFKPVTLSTDAQAKDQYARLPDMTVTGTYPNAWLGLNYTINSEATVFKQPLFEKNVDTTVNEPGARYVADPSINYRASTAWGYITPEITLNGSLYNLNKPIALTQSPETSSRFNRFIPSYDIDSGLYFDRSLHINQTEFTQTLEPRLFYLYTPFVSQNNIPIYDTSFSGLSNFSQLFSTNRFQGYDRIGDANQVSLGVTSRFIKTDTGADLLDMSIGQIRYFKDRDVQISGTTPPPEDTAAVSPVLGQINWQFLPGWTLTGNAAYSSIHNWLNNTAMSLSYSQDAQHYFTSGYSYTRAPDPKNRLEIANLGFVWPLTVHWKSYAGINYDLTQTQPQTTLYGVEYDNCCWQIRIIQERVIKGVASDGITPRYNNSTIISFAFTGLGGSQQKADIFNYAIAGYNDSFGQNPFSLPQA